MALWELKKILSEIYLDILDRYGHMILWELTELLSEINLIRYFGLIWARDAMRTNINLIQN